MLTIFILGTGNMNVILFYAFKKFFQNVQLIKSNRNSTIPKDVVARYQTRINWFS